jgi:hypothetical protein
MSNLNTAFNTVRQALAGLDTAMADAINAQTQRHQNELIELSQAYEEKMRIQRQDLEIRLEGCLEERLKLIGELGESRDISKPVLEETAGILPTENLLKRMFYEKLEQRWEFLTISEIQMMEEVLDGKVIRI